MATYLDLAMPIVEKDPDTGEFTATPYFEDYLYQLVFGLGGEEGESAALDALDLSNMLLSLQPVLPALASLKNRTDELEQLLAASNSESSQLKALLGRFKPIKSAKIPTSGTALTVTGNTFVTCNNTATATLTLNPSPVDLEEVFIKRNGDGEVNFIGNIDGSTTESIVSKGDGIHLIYSIAMGYWGAT
jgi:hypothetical protein